MGKRSGGPLPRRTSRSARSRAGLRAEAARAPLGRLLRNRLPGNGRADAARPVVADPRGRADRLRRAREPRRRLRCPRLPGRHRPPGRSGILSDRWRSCSRSHPAGAMSHVAPSVRATMANALQEGRPRHSPGPAGRPRGTARRQTARLGDPADVDRMPPPKPRRDQDDLQEAAQPDAHGRPASASDRRPSGSNRWRHDGWAGAMPRLRPPDRRTPGPHRHPEPLRRTRHPRHAAHRLTSDGERGSAAVTAFAQQGHGTYNR